jgi:hypothetical protein
MTKPKVVLFIDNSNIFISAKDVAGKKEGIAARNQVRLQFDNMLQLALKGRQLAKAYVVGSIPPEQRAVWDKFAAATGVKPELYERGSVSGGEQGLDQCLQVHMLRAISDYIEPQIAVLMTGDGAGYDDGVGFHSDLKRMHLAGWGIEVISWKDHCKRSLKDWASSNGVFISLDDYYEFITFLEDGARRAKSVNLTTRQTSTTRISPARAVEIKAKTEADERIRALENELAEVKAKAAEKTAKREKYQKRYDRKSKK